MATFSYLNAVKRVLLQFYWSKMRMQRRRSPSVGTDGETLKVISVSVRSAQIHLQAQASGLVRLMTDAGTLLARPDRTGLIDIEMPGVRYLVWHDDSARLCAEVPLYHLSHHVLCAFRVAVSLTAFPFCHASDLRDYFLRRDSSAGDRIERALLPPLSTTEEVSVAAENLFGYEPTRPVTEPVSIILPILNAADTLAECLERIAHHTQEPHRLLLVDDASSDLKVASLLEAFAIEYPHAELLRNETNLGFAETLNRGLDLATGHVVLLCPNTLVPEGWLTRLIAPILNDPDVATVTPLSNDASMLDASTKRRLLALTSVEARQADLAVARLDWRRVQAQIQAGDWACMAIARNWLGQIGILDPNNRDCSGEKSEWCRRATDLGAKHIGLGSLFVERRSGDSIGTEKAETTRKHGPSSVNKRITANQMVVRSHRFDPFIGPRLVIEMGLLDRGAPIAVYMAHRLGGGAEYWLQERLAEDIAQRGGAVVLRDDPESRRVLVEVHNEGGVTRGLLALADIRALLHGAERICLTYSCLASAYDPLRFVENMVAVLRPEDHLQIIFHDFMPLCPSYCLISAGGRYCGLPEAEACQSCYAGLAITSFNRPSTIAEWRAGWRRAADRADRLVTFSLDSRRHVLRVWPDLERKLVVQPHTITHPPRAAIKTARSITQSLTVGVLGAIGRQKGAAVLKSLAQRRDPELRIVVIGTLDPAYADPRIIVTGPYEREDVADIAEYYDVDLWLIPSIWPETFSYTTHECLATGLPVLSFDIGAQAEAVYRARNGATIPIGTVMTRQVLLDAVDKIGIFKE